MLAMADDQQHVKKGRSASTSFLQTLIGSNMLNGLDLFQLCSLYALEGDNRCAGDQYHD